MLKQRPDLSIDVAWRTILLYSIRIRDDCLVDDFQLCIDGEMAGRSPTDATLAFIVGTGSQGVEVVDDFAQFHLRRVRENR